MIPVLTVSQIREWEQATWASGQTEEAVMRQAGQAVARRVEHLTQPGDFVLVLAGKGHNGDDARFAAESNHLSGRRVHVLEARDPDTAISELAPLLARTPALLIDGLFGIGLNRALSTPWVNLIRAVNESGAPVLAVDVPSGLNAETGESMGQVVRAAHTVSFGAMKRGMLQASAVEFIGRLEVAREIGLLPCPFHSELALVEPQDFRGFPPARPISGHKGTFGHLALLAGSLGYHGASVLAARGAQRAQPGLITLFTADNVYQPVAGQLQSVMVRPWGTEFKLLESCTAIALGPGLASPDVPSHIRETVGRLWKESPLPVVADASALEWLPSGACPELAVRVMTPHPGEAARLLQVSSASVQADRPGALRKLSQRWGNCFVVLKGHQTLVGRGEGPLSVNTSGNPCLAQGGSGDLLTGYLGGLLAQPPLQLDPGTTIRFAVWQHGASADVLQANLPNWTVEDLQGVLGRVGTPRGGTRTTGEAGPVGRGL